MLNIKYIPNQLMRLFSLALVLNLIWLGLANSATAEQKSEKTRTADFGLPTHRRDGGTRGGQDSCVVNAENQNLIALIPQQDVGKNAAASPKLFFYIPELKQPTSTLEFVLRDRQDRLMYETFLSTEGNGILSIEIPAGVKSNLLKTEQNYHWYLSIICNHQQRSRDIVVEGWMRQEKLNLATQKQLNEASVLEKAEIYRQQGFWFDALSTLTENPDSVAEETMMRQKWSEMLVSAGLETLVSQPFIETKLIENLQDSSSTK
ncbi:MAG: hypothetical protein RLZZ381_1436 [Cyanobacteriota bacterium]|jgi:hypothetical protein